MKMSQQQNQRFNAIALRILLCLTLTNLCCAQATFDPNQFCTLVVNGTKVKDPRACNAWIQCIDEQPVSGTCPDELFYERESESCVLANSTTCVSSDPCASLLGSDGFVADPYSCNGYYYCRDGTGARGECSTGMNYNPRTEDCIRNFPCAAKMDPDSICNILPDGVFIKNTTNCNGWSMCWKGVIINGICPGTFYYNALKGDCDYPQNVECTEASTVAPLIAAPGVCTEAGMFIADNETCNGYYYCKPSDTIEGEFILEHGVCSNERFFDPINGGACITRTQIYCKYDRCAGLGTNGIQLANESADDCTGYAICQNGVTIGVGSCPSGQYFDEVNQLCTTQVIDYPACSLSSASTTSEVSTTTTATYSDSSSSGSSNDADATPTTNT